MNKTTKKIILIIIALVIVGSSAFYGGMKYGQDKNSSRQVFQELSQEQRQQPFQGRLRRGMEGGFLFGEVIDKDKKSLILKMPDGSSKIVFFLDSAQILKTIEGSIDDIEIGKQVMVNGDQNSDGSYTAKTIQLPSVSLTPRNNK